MTDHPLPSASPASDIDNLRLALKAANLGDWTWDAATDLVTLSPRAAEVFGVAAGPTLTWGALRDMLHPDDRDQLRLPFTPPSPSAHSMRSSAVSRLAEAKNGSHPPDMAITRIPAPSSE